MRKTALLISQLQLSLQLQNVRPSVTLSFPISHNRIAFILHTVGFGMILSVLGEIFFSPTPPLSPGGVVSN